MHLSPNLMSSGRLRPSLGKGLKFLFLRVGTRIAERASGRGGSNGNRRHAHLNNSAGNRGNCTEALGGKLVRASLQRRHP